MIAISEIFKEITKRIFSVINILLCDFLMGNEIEVLFKDIKILYYFLVQ